MGKDVKGFLEAIKDDKELQAKFKGITDKDGIIAAAKSAGYDITAEELDMMAKAKKGELKDDELESVAGGICIISILPDFSVVLLGNICIV